MSDEMTVLTCIKFELIKFRFQITSGSTDDSQGLVSCRLHFY